MVGIQLLTIMVKDVVYLLKGWISISHKTVSRVYKTSQYNYVRHTKFEHFDIYINHHIRPRYLRILMTKYEM